MIAQIAIYLAIFFFPLLMHLDWRLDDRWGQSRKRRRKRPRGLRSARTRKPAKSIFRIRNWQIVPLCVGALLVIAAAGRDHGAPEPIYVTFFALAVILFVVDMVLMVMRALRTL